MAALDVVARRCRGETARVRDDVGDLVLLRVFPCAQWA